MRDGADSYISISKAMSILDVSFERITWFIATGKLTSMRDPKDRSRKLVSLRDARHLLQEPHLLAKWIIYALIDPRDGAIRYIGQTKEPQVRLRSHITGDAVINPAKTRWLKELEKMGLQPYMDVIEGVNGSLANVMERERYWIRYYTDQGFELLNR